LTMADRYRQAPLPMDNLCKMDMSM